jgi:hypothetical protein
MANKGLLSQQQKEILSKFRKGQLGVSKVLEEGRKTREAKLKEKIEAGELPESELDQRYHQVVCASLAARPQISAQCRMP